MKMGMRFAVFYMIITGFLTHYFIMSNIMSYDSGNITNNLSKVYMSLCMAFIMGILEVVMQDMMRDIISYHYYIILTIFCVIFFWLYRKQVAINEVDYLKEMIEHHDMALFTSKNLLDKPNISPKVRAFAKKIVNDQTKEISEMHQLIENEKQKK
jgi:Domain of unknown function (DUF305)